MSKSSHVLLVDPHPIMHHGLRRLMAQSPGLLICGAARSLQQAVHAARVESPDLVVMELILPDGSGLDLIGMLRTHIPHVTILVLSALDELLYAEQVLHAGATGYVMKREAPPTVLTAVHRVLHGGVYVSERLQRRLLPVAIQGGSNLEQSSIRQLSTREGDVFRLMGQGLGSRQISEALQLSSKTVEKYRSRIRAKLGLTSSMELIRYALHWSQLQNVAPADHHIDTPTGCL